MAFAWITSFGRIEIRMENIKSQMHNNMPSEWYACVCMCVCVREDDDVDDLVTNQV